jgi:hypothetical protein
MYIVHTVLGRYPINSLVLYLEEEEHLLLECREVLTNGSILTNSNWTSVAVNGIHLPPFNSSIPIE